MSIANYFTFFRLLISPIFLFIYMGYEEIGIDYITMPFILLFLLLISECSDALDGYLARKYNQVTDLGKILDPMADSITRITIFLTFTQPPVNLPISLIFVILYRESVVSTLRTICALKGFALAARISGKIKAVIQGIAAFIIILLMILHAQGEISFYILQTISKWTVGIAAVYTFFSGIDYIYANRRYITRLLILQKSPSKLGIQLKKRFQQRKRLLERSDG